MRIKAKELCVGESFSVCDPDLDGDVRRICLSMDQAGFIKFGTTKHPNVWVSSTGPEVDVEVER